MSDASRKQQEVKRRSPGDDRQHWAADNDDCISDGIYSIVDALARAAARRDHSTALKENLDRD